MARLAGKQHGVVSRRQLRDLGITDASIAGAVATGHLHPSFRGVFGVGHPQVSERSWMQAAVLACGEGAVVSHRTAAALLGLQERAPVVVDVIAPREAGRTIAGIRRHHVVPPLGSEVGACDAIPCTSPSRTLVDLAGLLGARSLRRAVERAAVLGMLDAAATAECLARERRRGAPVLRAILSEWKPERGDGTGRRDEHSPRLRSVLEAHLLTLLSAAGLPDPLCNQGIEADGRRIEVDFIWPGQQLVVEVDGRRFHEGPAAFERDRARDQALQLSGYRVVRFTHAQIESEPEAVTSTIRRLLAAEFG